MNLLSKVWNKIVDIYYNVYEWFYITFNKTTYWEYELENGTVYCSISGGKMYITLSDYRILERDIIGRKMLKDLKEEQVSIKVVV